MKRALAWLPTVAFAATFGVFAVDNWDSFSAVASSGRAIAILAAIVAGYLLVRFALARTAPEWIGPLVLTALVLGLAAWTVLPYYTERTVNQELVAGPIVDPVPTTESRADVPTTGVPTTAPPGPVRVSSGSLVGTDHDAAGTVSVLRAPTGAVVVRFESFTVEGTPDPRLYVVPAADATDPGDGVDLGSFRGTRGDLLDVAVPAGTEVGQGWTVLLWCERFGVPIAFATQG